MHRQIKRWTDDAVIWEGDAETVKDALHAAIAAKADLRCADLTGAVLTGAVLTCADLTDAVLTDADLTRAVLTCAVLTRADLTGAVLTDADLTDAVLTCAVLTRADLTGAVLTCAVLTCAVLTRADLTGAVLTAIRDDVWAVLSSAPAEAPAVLEALRAGRVNGSTYHGACACLVGTIANARHCSINDLGSLRPNSSRPAEAFFMSIREGDTPETSQYAKFAAEWINDWLIRVRAAFGPTPTESASVQQAHEEGDRD